MIIVNKMTLVIINFANITDGVKPATTVAVY